MNTEETVVDAAVVVEPTPEEVTTEEVAPEVTPEVVAEVTPAE